MQLEEPRIDWALAQIMEMLDEEVPKALASFGTYANPVYEAQELLEHASPVPLRDGLDKARRDVQLAVHDWLTAWDNWFHFSQD